MTDRDALRRAILESPADDAPRLIYADYLDEHGEPERAEFIRVQCEIARFEWRTIDRTDVVCSQDVEAHEALRSRELGLLRDARLTWLWPGAPKESQTETDRSIGHMGPAGGPRFVFRRGFVVQITCPTAVLLGGVCGTYENGWHHRGSFAFGSIPCQSCRGSGATPGIAAELFRREPVEQVRLSDLEPWTGETNRHGYGWARVPTVPHRPLTDLDGRHWIPAIIFDRLPMGWGDKYMQSYPNRTVAVDALSMATVQHCRELAGLAEPITLETR